MRRQLFLIGVLACVLMTPAAPAKAGWPTFDVSKLAAQITNLVARFQPIPAKITRVSQLKEMVKNVQVTGAGPASNSLKGMGKEIEKAIRVSTYAGKGKNPFIEAAKGSSGAKEAAKKLKELIFIAKKGDKKIKMKDRQKIKKTRIEWKRSFVTELYARSLYMAMNSTDKSESFFKQADDTQKNVQSMHDAYNANTMMVLVGNFEQIKRISLILARVKNGAFNMLVDMPDMGYTRPVPKYVKMGESEYKEEEKDEANVNFE